MSRKDKLVERFRAKPKDFTWDELDRLLKLLGYMPTGAGRTAGSRRHFVHASAPAISLHKPHPGSVVKMYVIRDLSELLTKAGLL